MPKTLSLNLLKDQSEIVKTVLYFHVFNYPLTVDELYENSAVSLPRDSFISLLNELLDNGLLHQQDGFVFSGPPSEKDILKRTHGNKGATEIMATAYAYSKKIARFPFVEGLCLSGALSKNYYDENGDIDFFIITKPGRLWICRTLLIVRYKLLPQSKKKFWCTNYFISSDDLAIPDKNAFTATELAYLIPTVNYAAYQQLIAANSWYKKRFPNKSEAPDVQCIPASGYFFKSLMEALLGGRFGTWLDTQLFTATLKHWRKRYADMNDADFELQFRARKNVSKRHTKGFQNKVLSLWEEKRAGYEKEFKIRLG